jgi:hypothetical protein
MFAVDLLLTANGLLFEEGLVAVGGVVVKGFDPGDGAKGARGRIYGHFAQQFHGVFESFSCTRGSELVGAGCDLLEE